ncbi:MAG: type II toxin-antitoxin system RelB/DinJ family antitoxin [Clostridia bacterium]|nr:type II toxin-antitoxin system RelB/DinJ family antitoxin [Clostridia bacterium]
MATINVNVDEEIKQQAKETLDYLGTNFTNVINMLLRQVILTGSIPFEVKIPKLNVETIKAIEDAEKGLGLSKAYTDLDEMWKDLEKED